MHYAHIYHKEIIKEDHKEEIYKYVKNINYIKNIVNNINIYIINEYFISNL